MTENVWEIRSYEFGDSMKGVLLRNAPNLLNSYIHWWHKKIVLSVARGGQNVLDLGCGWGRLSVELKKKFPHIRITGIDISPNYVRMFRKATGEDAFAGEISEIGRIGTFDLILCVTVLLYFDGEKLDRAARNIMSNLSPNGRVVVIEGSPSGMFQTVSRLIGRRNTSTGGELLSRSTIESLFSKHGGKVYSMKTSPFSMYDAYVIGRQ